MSLFSPSNDRPAGELPERDQLIAKVRSLLRLEHQIAYGIDVVDERWLNALSDEALRAILVAHDALNSQYIY